MINQQEGRKRKREQRTFRTNRNKLHYNRLKPNQFTNYTKYK